MASESLKDFYSEKTIFLTGATGSLGRLLLAKLMRLGNLKEVLILSRVKKGKSNEERLSKVFSGILFQDMQKFDESFKHKVKVIDGDMARKQMGISFDDREYIKKNVQIIIHCAATVSFDERLTEVILINVQGTKYLLDLALEVENLISFVYMSTAYSQCPRLTIEEAFYQPPLDYRQALALLDSFDENVIDSLTNKIISPWPNTYTFSKAVTEDMIRQHQSRIPLAVFRPSIVQATHRDPVPGYADSLLGALGAGAGIMVGLLRVMKCNPDALFDIVPADFVIDSTLAVARFGAEKSFEGDNSIVFNCTIGNARPVTIRTIIYTLIKYMEIYPTKKMFWVPSFTITSSYFVYKVLFIFFHYIPAFFIDLVLSVKGSKLRLFKIYSKIFYYAQLYFYFHHRSWTFADKNMKRISSLMSDEDLQLFYCIPSSEEYEVHAPKSIDGLRKYLFLENDDDLVEARKKYKKLKIIRQIFLALLYCSFGYFCYWLMMKMMVRLS